MKPKKLLSLQCLRGLAALLIVLFHISSNYKEIFGSKLIFGLFDSSDASVDIFFVLSGFIIYYTSEKLIGTGHLKQYAYSRFTRIYPIYWISIIHLVFFRIAFDPNYSFDLLSFVKTIFLLPGHEMFNGVSWSLSHELYFYLLFALFIFNRKFLLLGATIFVLSIVQYIYPPLFSDSLVSFLFHKRNLLFAAGCLLAANIHNLPQLTSTKAKSLFIASLIGYFAWGFNNPSHQLDILIYGIIALCLVWSLLSLEPMLSKKSYQPFIKLGDASYALYLLHLPLANIFLKMMHRYQTPEWLRYLAIFGFITGLILMSILFFTFIEKPVMRFLNPKKAKSAPILQPAIKV